MPSDSNSAAHYALLILSSLDLDDLFICFLPELGTNMYWTKAAFVVVLKTLIQDDAIFSESSKGMYG